MWDRASTSRRGGSVSHATLVWEIPPDQELGTYRLRHKGYRKDHVKGDIFCYGDETTVSSDFEVVSSSYLEDRSAWCKNWSSGEEMDILLIDFVFDFITSLLPGSS